ncbi:MAG: class I SAM-dependent methyltransferase [Candidatus Binataceae bacterium]
MLQSNRRQGRRFITTLLRTWLERTVDVNWPVKLIGWKGTILHCDPSVYDRWRWLKCHLQPGPLRTLDAGCGSGAFTMYAAKIGNQSLGLSFDERNNGRAAARASILGLKNVAFRTIDLRRLDEFRDDLGQFDQIICCEVIEHILNDRKFLADLSELLKPGGRLLLTTPNKHLRPLPGDSLSKVEDGGHVRTGYTHEEMRHLFGESGLHVFVEEYISGVITQKLCYLERRLAKRISPLVIRATLPLHILHFFDSHLTRAIQYPFFCIGVVGSKHLPGCKG